MSKRKILKKLAAKLSDKKLSEKAVKVEEKNLDTAMIDVDELESVLGDKELPPVEIDTVSME